MHATTLPTKKLIALLAASASIAGFSFASAQAAPEASPVMTTAMPAPEGVPASVMETPVASAMRAEAHWSTAQARDLLAAINDAPREGLDTAPYRPDLLRLAIEDGQGAALDAVARTAALALASDYFDGRVADKRQFDWHIDRSPYLAMQLPAALDKAVAEGRVSAWLRSQLPQNDDYRALRTALAETNDGAERDRLRANMERWRWMPRELGEKYLYVNVPSYKLDVVDGGSSAGTYTVVVGAPKTPTPMMTMTAQSLVVNPWWSVPQSIVKSSNLRPGRAGYKFVSTGDGYAVRQPPGPRNALGKVKIDMPNAQAIYFHDTPSKSGFARDQRALSHGCIRVQDIDRLAADLMSAGGGDPASFETAYAGSDTRTMRLPQSWPVYLVYFTAARDDAGGVKTLPDIYGRDTPLIAALDKRVMMASR